MAEHINADGDFQSDKYPWCKPGFVPLKLTDPGAWRPLWDYAEQRRKVDAAFADDLQACLRSAGFTPTGPRPTPFTDETRTDQMIGRGKVEALEAEIARDGLATVLRRHSDYMGERSTMSWADAWATMLIEQAAAELERRDGIGT